MSEIWEAIQTNFVIILMVTARVSGIFTFNPIFSRNGVPNMVKAGASLMLALVMAAAGDFSYTIPQGVLPFARSCSSASRWGSSLTSCYSFSALPESCPTTR